MTGRLSAALIALAAVAAGAVYLGSQGALHPGAASDVLLAKAPAVLLAGLPWVIVGAFLRLRRPEHLAGWLVAGIGLAQIAGSGTADLYRAGAITTVDRGLVAWGNGAIWAGALLDMTVLLATFPVGRIAPGPGGRPTRLVVGIAVVAFLAVAAGGALGTAFAPIANAGLWAGNLVLLAAIADYARRFRHTVGVARAQQKWFAWSLGFVALGVLAALATAAVTGLAAWSVVNLAAVVPAVAIGVAVTRYRLYDIDRVISRTASWALLTAALVGVYAGIVLVLQSALSGVTQGGTLAVAGSTLGAAAVFQPLRVRIQSATDRRFDRGRYDAERTAAAFADRLRDEVDLVRVGGDLRSTAEGILRPAHASVWIREAEA